MKKMLALLCLFVLSSSLKAEELSDIAFGTTTYDEAEKIIDETCYMGISCKYYPIERILYKALFNTQAHYCQNIAKKNDCQKQFVLQQNDLADVNSLILKTIGVESKNIVNNEILSILESDKNINVYLHEVYALSYKLPKNADDVYYTGQLKKLTGKVGGITLNKNDEQALLKDEPSTKNNLLKFLLDKVAILSSDTAEIQKYLKGNGLNLFAQYLADQSSKKQQQQQQQYNLYVQPIHNLAQGLSDIK